MSRVKVRIEGHYEVRELPYGKDYTWSPTHALIECGCGHELYADAHHTICPKCGADHVDDVVREVSGRHRADEVLHPWHPEYEEWLRFKEDRTEYEEWR